MLYLNVVFNLKKIQVQRQALQLVLYIVNSYQHVHNVRSIMVHTDSCTRTYVTEQSCWSIMVQTNWYTNIHKE